MKSFKTNLAQNYYEVYFGGNWTASSFIKTIEDISFEDARKEVYDLNSILTLSYHIHYYTHSVLNYLKGNSFVSSDKESFITKEIQSEHDWIKFKERASIEAKEFATKLEEVTETDLDDFFIKEEYGSIFRNYHGIIEHTHYHLGQIQILKKLISHN